MADASGGGSRPIETGKTSLAWTGGEGGRFDPSPPGRNSASGSPVRPEAGLRGEEDSGKPIPGDPGSSLPPRFGRYKIGRMCGDGGMGTVYQATDVWLHREVAIKVPVADRCGDRESRSRFLRERQACARMDHANVVRVHDAGDEAGIPFLVMELLEGITLQDVSDRHGPIPSADAVAVAIQALEGLDHAFGRGVVHRDIKPSNLILTPGGIVKILDWGLARFLEKDEESDAGFVTRAIFAFGTPLYMAPERILRPEMSDIRSDLYSLGATLYTLLAGHPPWGPEGLRPSQARMASMTQMPKPLREIRRDIPPGLDRVILKLLEKEPEGRPATPEQTITLLSPFAGGSKLTLLLTSASASDMAHVPPTRSLPDSKGLFVEPLEAGQRPGAPWAAAVAVAIAAAIAGIVLVFIKAPDWSRSASASAGQVPTGAAPVPVSAPPASSVAEKSIAVLASPSPSVEEKPIAVPVASAVLPPDPPAPRELKAETLENSRRIYRPGEMIRLRVLATCDGRMVAYQVPVVAGIAGRPRPLRAGAAEGATAMEAGRARELEAEARSSPGAGSRGRGILVLALAPPEVGPAEADTVGTQVMSGLEGRGVEDFEALKETAWPEGWSCLLLRYSVTTEPGE